MWAVSYTHLMKTWKVEAAIIAVGMVLLGVIIKWGINDFILRAVRRRRS